MKIIVTTIYKNCESQTDVIANPHPMETVASIHRIISDALVWKKNKPVKDFLIHIKD